MKNNTQYQLHKRLSKAIIRQDINEIKDIIAEGIDLNKQYKIFESHLFNSIFQNNFEIIKLLIDAGMNIETIPDFALNQAIFLRNVDLINLWLKHGADINIRDSQNQTPIYSVFFSNSKNVSAIEVLEILLNKGAELNVKDMNGNTPQHYCCRFYYWYQPKDFIKTMKFLIKKGADITVKNKYGEKPFDFLPLKDRIVFEFERYLQYLCKKFYY